MRLDFVLAIDSHRCDIYDRMTIDVKYNRLCLYVPNYTNIMINNWITGIRDISVETVSHRYKFTDASIIKCVLNKEICTTGIGLLVRYEDMSLERRYHA